MNNIIPFIYRLCNAIQVNTTLYFNCTTCTTSDTDVYSHFIANPDISVYTSESTTNDFNAANFWRKDFTAPEKTLYYMDSLLTYSRPAVTRYLKISAGSEEGLHLLEVFIFGKYLLLFICKLNLAYFRYCPAQIS